MSVHGVQVFFTGPELHPVEILTPTHLTNISLTSNLGLWETWEIIFTMRVNEPHGVQGVHLKQGVHVDVHPECKQCTYIYIYI